MPLSLYRMQHASNTCLYPPLCAMVRSALLLVFFGQALYCPYHCGTVPLAFIIYFLRISLCGCYCVSSCVLGRQLVQLVLGILHSAAATTIRVPDTVSSCSCGSFFKTLSWRARFLFLWSRRAVMS